MLHQHADGKADDVGVLRSDPPLDILEQLRAVLFKDLRRELVAGRPVVDLRQKPLCLKNAAVEILHLRDQERVQLVLIKVLMRQVFQEALGVRIPGQFLRKLPELGRPDSDHLLRVHRRDQFDLKLPVVRILHRKKLLSYLFSVHNHPRSFPLLRR